MPEGKKLTTLPVLHTTWGDWRKQHPDTQVLAPQTGYYWGWWWMIPTRLIPLSSWRKQARLPCGTSWRV
ncbi:DUF3179 domain-containing (seleno)protein [Thiothrix subterranea]|uniref:DUF3179 domain-containing (seleno)protein n=1 Tax=Thiothrix subterranea TaxID=2735563 RepID=UPI0035A6DEA4